MLQSLIKKSKLKNIFFFLIIALIFIGYCLVKSSHITLYYDSRDYYSYSQHLNSQTVFDFAHYSKYDAVGNINPRGYFFSHLIYFELLFSRVLPLSHFQFIALSNCLIFLTTIFLLRRFVFTSRPFTPPSLAVLLFLSLLFWEDLFVYPLSDLTGICFLFSSLSLLTASLNFIKRRHYLFAVLFYFVAGALLYASVNIRVVYLAAALGLIIYFFVKLFFSRRFLISLGCVLAFLVGALLFALPEMLINFHYFSSFSPLPVTTGWHGNQNLLFAHFRDGLVRARYDTTLLTDAPQLIVANSLSAPLARDFTSVGEYLLVLTSHPLITLQMCALHFFYLYSTFFRHVYLASVVPNYFLLIFNYTLFFLVGAHLIYALVKTQLLRREPALLGLFICLIINTLVLLPMQAESRYGIGLFLFVYFYFVFYLLPLIKKTHLHKITVFVKSILT